MPNEASAWLLRERTSQGMSQRELAGKIGVSNETISRAEEGYASPKTWRKLAEYFESPINSILAKAGFLDKEEMIEDIEQRLREFDPATRKKIIKALQLDK